MEIGRSNRCRVSETIRLVQRAAMYYDSVRQLGRTNAVGADAVARNSRGPVMDFGFNSFVIVDSERFPSR